MSNELAAEQADQFLPTRVHAIVLVSKLHKPALRALGRASPRGVVAVYIPEYVLGHWWERLLHNQSAFRIKSRLLFQPGVTITSVPYQLRSSEAALERARRADRQL